MKDIFPIIPAGSGSLWLLVIIALLLLATTAFIGVIALSSRTSSVELSIDGLRIRSAFYGRTIPWSSVTAEASGPVDLTHQTEFAPAFRTNGIGLPGYGTGWFRLNNGNTALAFVSDRRRVAYIPTRDFALLLSVPDPDALVASVKQWAARSQQ